MQVCHTSSPLPTARALNETPYALVAAATPSPSRHARRVAASVSIRPMLPTRAVARAHDDTRVYADRMTRIFDMSVAAVYVHYVAKVERKGGTRADVDEVTRWLTGFDQAELDAHLTNGTSFADFFAQARLNPRAVQITGVICGIRMEEIEDPLMQKIRYLDKLVDEVARGKTMQKVLRA